MSNIAFMSFVCHANYTSTRKRWFVEPI